MRTRLLALSTVFAAALLFLGAAAESLAETVTVDVQRSGGVPVLDAAGNWVWEVTYQTSPSIGALAVEFGIDFADADVLSGSVTTTGIGNGDVEVANPGEFVFGWETPTGGFGGAFPEGLQVDASQGTNGQAFYAYGTGVLSASTSLQLATFTTQGPTLAAPTSGLDLIGAYDVAGNLVGSLPGTHGLVFTTVGLTPIAASAAITAKAGDIDLDDFVDADDTSVLLANFGSAVGNGWAGGDLDGDTQVDFADVFAFSPTYEAATGASGSGVAFSYNPTNGEVTLQPNGNEVGLIRLSSASGAFTGSAATLPAGEFATDTDSLVGVVIDTGAGGDVTNDVSLGAILPSGLTEAFLLGDLTLDWSGGFGTPNESASLVVGVPAFLPGDFSGDGVVDNNDLNLLLVNWGAPTPPAPTGWDGFQPIGASIDNDELNALLVNWGAGTSVAVPESTAALMLAVGIAAIRRR